MQTDLTKLPDGDRRHGTPNGYRLSCRCDECRAANAAAMTEYRESKKANPLPSEDPRHGKRSTYNNYSCRCTPCNDANTAYQAELRAVYA